MFFSALFFLFVNSFEIQINSLLEKDMWRPLGVAGVLPWEHGLLRHWLCRGRFRFWSRVNRLRSFQNPRSCTPAHREESCPWGGSSSEATLVPADGDAPGLQDRRPRASTAGARVTRSSEEGGEDGPSCPETRTYRSAALSPSGTSPGTRGGGWLRTPAPSPGGPGASLHSSGLQPHILLPVTPKYSLHSESLMDTRLPRRGERERSFSPWILRARLGPHPLAGQKALRTLGRCRMPASCVHLWAASASFPAFLSFSQTRVTKTDIQTRVVPAAETSAHGGKKAPRARGLEEGDSPAGSSSAAPTA